jgi:hypothetical protein
MLQLNLKCKFKPYRNKCKPRKRKINTVVFRLMYALRKPPGYLVDDAAPVFRSDDLVNASGLRCTVPRDDPRVSCS